MKNLVLAGGVALNCVANGRLLREGPFRRLWIQPAAGDAGGALGAALFVWHQLLGKSAAAIRPRLASRAVSSVRAFTTDEIARFLDGARGAASALRRRGGAAASTSPGCWPTERSSAGSRAAWSSARGHSAPGASSAIRGRRAMQAIDESEDQVPRELPALRPVRAAGTGARVVRYSSRARKAPTCCWSRRCGKTVGPRSTCRTMNTMHGTTRTCASGSTSCDRRFPAMTHVDYSARLQTVDERAATRGSIALLEAFRRADRLPGARQHQLQRPRRADRLHAREDAYRCFLATDMDVLVLEDIVITKDAAARQAGEAVREQYLAQFQLD